MILVKKLKSFYLFCLWKIDWEKVFADVLDKKEAFKDYKTTVYEKHKIRFFGKGVSPSFWSKITDFFNFDFYAK